MKSECNEFYSQLCKQTKLISHDYFALIKMPSLNAHVEVAHIGRDTDQQALRYLT